MDTSGNNRYELLFMDDDISDPLDNIVAKKKKQVKSTTASTGTVPNQRTASKQSAEGISKVNSNTANTSINNSKKLNQAEKENKPLNKNEGQKKNPSTGTGTGIGTAVDKPNKQSNSGGFGNGNGIVGGGGSANRKRNNVDGREGGQGTPQQRNANFRQQNGETREQRNNRRNSNRENMSSTNVGNSSGAMEASAQTRQFKSGDRPPRNNRNFEGGNRKREFDRQSGSDKTGVKAVDKRDGSGAHNWGSVKDTIDEMNTKNNNNEDNANNLPAYTSGGTEKIEETINEQQQSNEPTNTVDEEVKELTLDEWKAQQQQRAKPQFNIRKAGEGEDTSQWKKMIVLNNNKKKENESEEELEYDPAMYPQRVGRQQRILDIQFNFNDGRRIGGFGGRGRGGGRGGGGSGGTNAPRSTGNNNNDTKPRTTGGGNGGGISGTGANNVTAGGGGRGGKRQFTSDKHQQNLALKVNDERQFPTLA